MQVVPKMGTIMPDLEEESHGLLMINQITSAKVVVSTPRYKGIPPNQQFCVSCYKRYKSTPSLIFHWAGLVRYDIYGYFSTW